MVKLFRAKKTKTKCKINVVLTFSDMGSLNQRQMLKYFRYQKKNKAKQIKASLLNLQGKSTSNQKYCRRLIYMYGMNQREYDRTCHFKTSQDKF